MSQGWKWTEQPEFAEACEALDDDPGEVDFLRGVIADSILEDPINGSNALLDPGDPGYDPDERYFRTKDAPGLSHLEPKIIVFRVEADDTDPRELTGLRLLDDDEA